MLFPLLNVSVWCLLLNGAMLQGRLSHPGYIPLLPPVEGGFSVFEGDGKPDVAGVAGMLRPPYVGHVDELVADGKDEGRLSSERDFLFGTHAGVGVLGPWSPDALGGEHACLVRVPACAARGDHPVGAVFLENGRSLVVACRSQPGVAACVVQVVVGLSAEIERNLISQRTKKALARKKAEGVVLGRPKGRKSAPNKYKLSGKEKLISELLKKGISKREIAKISKVDRNTLKRFIELKGLEEK